MAKKKRGSWIVRIRATVEKDLTVEDATEDEARADPYDCEVIDEQELHTEEYTVLDVQPNE